MKFVKIVDILNDI